MPDPSDNILQMIQNNPEAYQPQAPTAAPVIVGGDRDRNFEQYGTGMPSGTALQNTWATQRGARTRSALQNPEFQDSLAAHHNAVADTQALDHAASTELGLYHAARIQHDTGAYHQALHGMDPTDPQYEDKMLSLAAQYPFAKPDAELTQPLHEARRTFVTATGIQAQREQAKQVSDMIGKSLVTDDEAQNASSFGQLQRLAATREAERVPALNDAERAMMKQYGTSPIARTSAYKNLYTKAMSGDADAKAEHDTLWNVWKKSGVAAKTPASAGTTPGVVNPLFKP